MSRSSAVAVRLDSRRFFYIFYVEFYILGFEGLSGNDNFKV